MPENTWEVTWTSIHSSCSASLDPEHSLAEPREEYHAITIRKKTHNQNINQNGTELKSDYKNIYIINTPQHQWEYTIYIYFTSTWNQTVVVTRYRHS